MTGNQGAEVPTPLLKTLKNLAHWDAHIQGPNSMAKSALAELTAQYAAVARLERELAAMTASRDRALEWAKNHASIAQDMLAKAEAAEQRAEKAEAERDVRDDGLHALQKELIELRGLHRSAEQEAARLRVDGEQLTLSTRIDELAEQHGSLRAAARALDVDHGYLSRLRSGGKDDPSDALLEKMALRRVVLYRRAGRETKEVAFVSPEYERQVAARLPAQQEESTDER